MFIFDANDRELIVQQCTHQKATRPEDIAGFALAYAYAKLLCLEIIRNGVTNRGIEDFILIWGKLVDSRNNCHGWRDVAVTFANGKEGLAPRLIPRAMEQFCSSFADRRFPTAAVAYKAFEEIHPFLDGNGRVGHILYAVYNYMQNREWPNTLPPNIFSE